MSKEPDAITDVSDQSRSQSPGARKKTQAAILWGLLAVIVGVAAVSSIFFDKTPTSAPVATTPQAPPVTIQAPGGTLNAQDVWVARSADELKSLTETNKSLTDTQKVLMDRLASIESGATVLPQSQNATPSEPKPLMDFSKNPIHVQMPQQAPPAPPQGNLPPQPPKQMADVVMPQEKLPAGISVGFMNDQAGDGAASSRRKAPEILNAAAGDSKSVGDYIPSGSFARITILGGIDAPTGGQSQTQPQPVYFRFDNNAFLPNKYRFQVKECMGIGSGYGDISSERAYIRAESMSCILDDGETIDIPIKGYIAGEDGKTGIHGRLVSKQGQILANALIAGIGSGIGQAFQSSANTQSISALGTTNTVNPNQALQSGVSTGVGKALDRLANYYIQLAEKTFPVIEVDAGRAVDLVFTGGVSFKHRSLGNAGKQSSGARLQNETNGKHPIYESLDKRDKGYYD